MYYIFKDDISLRDHLKDLRNELETPDYVARYSILEEAEYKLKKLSEESEDNFFLVDGEGWSIKNSTFGLKLNRLEQELTHSLIKLGVGFSDDLKVRIENSRIIIGISTKDNGSNFNFGSEITYYSRKEITVSSASSISPKYQADFWKLKHASTILENWDIVTPMFDSYIEKYKEIYSI